MTTADQRQPRDTTDGHVLIGAALILVGLAFLADQVNWFDVHISGHFWPFILVFLGAARVLAPGYRHGRRRSRRSGFWLLSIGIWGTICEFELFGLDYPTAWPLLIVAAGLNIVWRSLEPSGAAGSGEHAGPQVRES